MVELSIYRHIYIYIPTYLHSFIHSFIHHNSALIYQDELTFLHTFQGDTGAFGGLLRGGKEDAAERSLKSIDAPPLAGEAKINGMSNRRQEKLQICSIALYWQS